MRFTIALAISICIWSGIFYRYYRRQNAAARMGGPISAPKAFWLGITTFSYFVFPCLVFGFSGEKIALLMGAIWLLRGIFQTVWMFFVKKWSPYMGIAFNLAYSLIVIYAGADARLLSGYWAGLMLTDTLFAWQFYKIVGKGTQGAEAIWYADDSPQFRSINRQTMVANGAFLVFLLYICCKLL